MYPMWGLPGYGVEDWDDDDDMHYMDDKIKDIRVNWWNAVILKKELTFNYKDEPSSMKGVMRLLPNYSGRSFRSKNNGIINLTMTFTTFNDGCVLKLMQVPDKYVFEVCGEIEENFSFNASKRGYPEEEHYKLAIRGLHSYDASLFGNITEVAKLVTSKAGMV